MDMDEAAKLPDSSLTIFEESDTGTASKMKSPRNLAATIFGESDTHQSTFSKNPSNLR